MSKAAWEVERALLGGLLLDPSQLMDVAERVAPESFSRPPHQNLFKLMLQMQEQGQKAEIVSVVDEIARREADDFDGIAYVTQLPNACPSVENLGVYAERVRDASLRRRLVDAAQQIAEAVKNDPKDLPALMDDAEKTIFGVTQLSGREDWHPLSEVIDDEFKAIQERAKSPGHVVGLPTGFCDLDTKLTGLAPGQLVVLAARPGMGKSAFALNIALNAARSGAVGIFTLEMSRQEVATRMLCSHAEVDMRAVRTGILQGRDWSKLATAAEELHTLPIEIDDSPGVTIMQLRSKARRLWAKRRGLGLIVVDYLQLMSGSGGSKESRENAISTISRGLKVLAKELEVPVIALSQLNRGVESRTDKRPLPSDLRESGAIEQDADIILFIYRDDFYNKDSPDKGLAEIIIAKNRAGPTDTVKLIFEGQFTRFDNWADPNKVGDGYV